MKRIFTTLAILFTLQANAQLNSFDWAQRTGSTSNDEGVAIVSDAAGNN